MLQGVVVHVFNLRVQVNSELETSLVYLVNFKLLRAIQ